MVVIGAATASTAASTVATIARISSRLLLPAFAMGRRFFVKNGITRPPMSTRMTIMTPSTPRVTAAPVLTTPAASRCSVRFARASRISTMGKTILRRFFVAISGLSMATAASGRKATSTAATTCQGRSAPVSMSTRPATHRTASPASGAPVIVGRPVQLGTAVRRNPTRTAEVKPNSISCVCQESGLNPVGSARCPCQTATHSGIQTTARPAASR